MQVLRWVVRFEVGFKCDENESTVYTLHCYWWNDDSATRQIFIITRSDLIHIRSCQCRLARTRHDATHPRTPGFDGNK